MKKFFTCLLMAILFSIGLIASSATDGSEDKILFQSGYGYSWIHNKVNGFNTEQSISYLPFKHWSFGVEVSLGKGNKDKSEMENTFMSKRIYSYLSVGPLVSYFPIRTCHHNVYISASVNYMHDEEENLLGTSGNEKVTQYWMSFKNDHIAPSLALGYYYDVYKGFGIGVKAKGTYCNDIRLTMLFNMSFSF